MIDQWEEVVLTREDVGYGPARPYEYSGPAMEPPLRERRGRRVRTPRSATARPRGLGPYFERLRRRRRPDAWILAEVEEMLFLDTWIDADRITVSVNQGVVTLIGTLPNTWEVERAVAVARSVPGVLGLRNLLETGP